MMVHIRYDGRSIDLPLQQLDLGDLSSDRQVRHAVANHLGQPTEKFANFVVDRNKTTGDITLRPQAVFGESPCTKPALNKTR